MNDIDFDSLQANHSLIYKGAITKESLPGLDSKYGALPVVAIDTKPYNEERLYPDRQGDESPSTYYQVYFGLPDNRGDIAIEITQNKAHGTHAEEGAGYWVSAWDQRNNKPVRCGHLQPDSDKPLLEQLTEFVNRNHALGASFSDLDITKATRSGKAR